MIFTAIDLSQPRKFVRRLADGEISINKEVFKTIVKVSATTITITLLNADIVSASPIADRITAAINPIIEAVQALGTPLCYLAIVSGAVVMMFNKRAGLKIIKTAIVGYIVLQFTPTLFALFKDLSRAIGS